MTEGESEWLWSWWGQEAKRERGRDWAQTCICSGTRLGFLLVGLLQLLFCCSCCHESGPLLCFFPVSSAPTSGDQGIWTPGWHQDVPVSTGFLWRQSSADLTTSQQLWEKHQLWRPGLEAGCRAHGRRWTLLLPFVDSQHLVCAGTQPAAAVCASRPSRVHSCIPSLAAFGPVTRHEPWPRPLPTLWAS